MPCESLADPVVTTFILLWGSIREPLLKKVLGDDEYLWSFTKGFAELPSPAQVGHLSALGVGDVVVVVSCDVCTNFVLSSCNLNSAEGRTR